jgi:hypothetical protein
MATFGDLFDFPDLSDGQSELSSPPDSSDDEHSDEHTEDEDDIWYNLPTDSEDEDEDDDSSPPLLVLPIRPVPLTELVISTAIYKEYSTGTRIKAIYILEDRKTPAQIKKAIGVPKTTVYRLYTIAREYSWRENEDIPLETSYVLNIPRSGRPPISINAIKCILKVVL